MPITRAALEDLEGHLKKLLDLLSLNISELSPDSDARATLECIRADYILPALQDLQNLALDLTQEEAGSNGSAWTPEPDGAPR
jgi:hypothetical protein